MIERMTRGALVVASPVLLLTFAATGGGGASKQSTVSGYQSLLKEHRELLEQKELEERRWEREKGELQILLRERKERVEKLTQTAGSVKRRVDSLKASVDSEKGKLNELRERSGNLRKWIQDSSKALKAMLSENPLLIEGKLDEELSRLSETAEPREGGVRPDGDLEPAEDLAARFWNILLRLASFSVKARVETEVIDLQGSKLEVSVLRLGASSAVFLTLDRETCGLCEVEGGELNWRALPEKYLDRVILAFEVAKEEIPAELLWIPLSRSRLSLEED